MTVDLHAFIVRAWAIVGIVWLIAGIGAKRAARRMPPGAMVVHSLALALAFGLFTRFFRVGFLRARFVPAYQWVSWLGCVITLAGFAFVLWARYCLGRNWSGTVQVKQGHTLVRSGPYRLVRHPIYTGFTVALLGTALVYGELRCLIGAALAFFEWKLKSLIEERFMIEEFGREYIDYRRQVKGLIPFVW